MGNTSKGGREWPGQDPVGLSFPDRQAGDGQPDIVVVDKHKKAGVVDRAVNSYGNIWNKSLRNGESVENEGQSGPCGIRRAWGGDPQTGRVALAGFMNNMQHHYPKECSSSAELSSSLLRNTEGHSPDKWAVIQGLI